MVEVEDLKKNEFMIVKLILKDKDNGIELNSSVFYLKSLFSVNNFLEFYEKNNATFFKDFKKQE